MRKGTHHSIETRAKLSAAKSGKNHPFYGKHFSPEMKIKSSKSHMGKKNSMYGKHHTAETKAKISAALTGRVVSHETRLKMSKSFSGKNHPLYGTHPSEETRRKLSEVRMGPKNHMWGKRYSQEKCAEMREISIALNRCGENNPNWRGGLSFEPYCPKWTEDLRKRIRAFFEYECIACGKPEKMQQRSLSCHHVEYNKQACCDGKPVQFACLCGRCHSRTNFDRARWEAMIHRIIDEIYGGRSYFTKDEWAKRGKQ